MKDFWINGLLLVQVSSKEFLVKPTKSPMRLPSKLWNIENKYVLDTIIVYYVLLCLLFIIHFGLNAEFIHLVLKWIHSLYQIILLRCVVYKSDVIFPSSRNEYKNGISNFANVWVKVMYFAGKRLLAVFFLYVWSK